ncbi:ribbon-helix-helix domain-containing protein [Microvirga yunnanensis]|uniref:ribbon-helix-helix domain-containing protein n=1 Tax=Microvirga yunnanensis TaxID=2953740 RepID=UPI0021C6C711|nr:type II toxin-antitoxin system ParD family antitoxin [Microvirga sp. HBU65207]
MHFQLDYQAYWEPYEVAIIAPISEASMPAKLSLNASLTLELAAFVSAKVQSADYGSASEVTRAALRLLVAQDRRAKRRSDAEPTDGCHGH